MVHTGLLEARPANQGSAGRETALCAELVGSSYSPHTVSELTYEILSNKGEGNNRIPVIVKKLTWHY